MYVRGRVQIQMFVCSRQEGGAGIVWMVAMSNFGRRLKSVLLSDPGMSILPYEEEIHQPMALYRSRDPARLFRHDEQNAGEPGARKGMHTASFVCADLPMLSWSRRAHGVHASACGTPTRGWAGTMERISLEGLG